MFKSIKDLKLTLLCIFIFVFFTFLFIGTNVYLNHFSENSKSLDSEILKNKSTEEIKYLNE